MIRDQMIELYLIAPIVVFILGLTFVLVWVGDRLNRAALLWGLSHFSLSIASFSGFYFQLHQTPIFGAISLLLTSYFLATFYGANEFLQGRRASHRRLILNTFCIAFVVGLVGFGIDQLAGRVLVVSTMILLYFSSAYQFTRRLHLPLVGLVFLFRGMALLLFFTDMPSFSTSHQPTLTVAINSMSSVLLGLVLVYVVVRQTFNRLNQVINWLPDPVIAFRPDGVTTFCNQSFAKLFGFDTPTKLIGGKHVALLASDNMEWQKLALHINSVVSARPMSAPIVVEQEVTTAAGTTFSSEITLSTFVDLGNLIVLAQIRDLSERKKAEEERIKLVTTDAITGLPNRLLIEQQLQQVLWEAEREGTLAAALLIDIDRFKTVNEILGYEQGNAVIHEIGQILTTQKLPRYLLGRLSGAQFVLVMTDLPNRTGILEIENTAKKICGLLKREIRQGDINFKMFVSIGIALSDSAQNPQMLLQHAEAALRETKLSRKGEWGFFNSGMDARLVETLRMESLLRNAIANNELQLYYQPIIDAKNSELVKVEALIRWNSPVLGWVSPAIFIPLAEQSELIIDIGSWVLKEAVEQASRWKKLDVKAPVISINVSVKQFVSREFEQLLFTTLEAHTVQTNQIELELTETLFANDQGELSSLLKRLYEAGFGLSLDDFGTGYSSLSYLSKFNLTTVKIDRSFISGLEIDDRSHSLVRAIIAMGHSLGLKVVAEGVETSAQSRILIAEECDYLQGYLFGKPAPSDTFFQLD